MAAWLSAIRLYPVKSLDPVGVPEARIAPSGGLAGDRRWALFEGETLVNGKKEPAVHRIRTVFDRDLRTVKLGGDSFRLEGDLAPLEAALSERLGRKVRLGEGSPDDLEASGPTLVSTASLETVAGWFGLALEEVRRRFRANLEIGGLAPFGEDRLIASPFRIGEVGFEGANSCQRCAVPSRDSATGEPTPGFQKTFAGKRGDTLPPWADRTRFDHFYRFTLNTRVVASGAGKLLRAGDPLTE